MSKKDKVILPQLSKNNYLPRYLNRSEKEKCRKLLSTLNEVGLISDLDFKIVVDYFLLELKVEELQERIYTEKNITYLEQYIKMFNSLFPQYLKLAKELNLTPNSNRKKVEVKKDIDFSKLTDADIDNLFNDIE